MSEIGWDADLNDCAHGTEGPCTYCDQLERLSVPVGEEQQ
jgi:hypothetical protein